MNWSSFWSAVIGGVLVIAGHVVVHSLNRRADAAKKKEVAEQQIATLVLDVVNWFEMDKQLVISAAGGPVESIQSGHPIHALAALIRIARPDLTSAAEKLIDKSRKYFDITRILLPAAPQDQRDELVNRFVTNANSIMGILDTVLDSVCGTNTSR